MGLAASTLGLPQTDNSTSLLYGLRGERCPSCGRWRYADHVAPDAPVKHDLGPQTAFVDNGFAINPVELHQHADCNYHPASVELWKRYLDEHRAKKHD
jgi:hypothetical protein